MARRIRHAFDFCLFPILRIDHNMYTQAIMIYNAYTFTHTILQILQCARFVIAAVQDCNHAQSSYKRGTYNIQNTTCHTVMRRSPVPEIVAVAAGNKWSSLFFCVVALDACHCKAQLLYDEFAKCRPRTEARALIQHNIDAVVVALCMLLCRYDIR